MRCPLFCWVLLAAACGAPAAPRPPAAGERFVDTGDALPAPVGEPAACAAAGGQRWLGAEPHVPLAVSGPDGIAAADACCAAWARAGDTWTALDAWGAPLGEVTVAGGEGYDVTQCYELDLGATPAGAVAFVRGDAAWAAPPSAAWQPSGAERDALLTLAGALDAVLAAPSFDLDATAAPARPLAERVVFFALPGDAADDRVATRFAAIGGRALAIAGLDAAGRWRLHYLDPAWGLAAGPWLAEPYRILGVLDADGDGVPEVLVHRSDGPGWDDALLECEAGSTLRPWRVVAESVGGSTA